MDLSTAVNELLPLSSAQIWLLLAAAVFTLCVIMMLVIFWQFRQHQSLLRRENVEQVDPEAVLMDMNRVTGRARYILKEKPIAIGRVPTKDPQRYDSIIISDVTVGRFHATIEYENGCFWIRDQGSVNGCYVNGKRVTGEYPLKRGDFIKIHKFLFQYLDGVSTTASASSTSQPTLELSDTSSNLAPTLDSIELEPNEVTILDMPLSQIKALSDTSSKERENQRTLALSRKEIQGEFEKNSRERELELTDPQIREGIKDITTHLFQEKQAKVEQQTLELQAQSRNDEADQTIDRTLEKTLRLYAKHLSGPPEVQPSYDEQGQGSSKPEQAGAREAQSRAKATGPIVERETEPTPTNKKRFSAENLQLVPDIDKKVVEALGDFFSSTLDLDDMEIPGELDLRGDPGANSAEEKKASITKFPDRKAVNARRRDKSDT